MKDYVQIMTKIEETPWMITSQGLDTILGIVEKHRSGQIDANEIRASIDSTDRNAKELQIVNGVGILPIHGPIFGKANLMTQMSGAVSLEMFQKDFQTLLADRSVHTIMLNIDSPGGTTDMLDETAQMIFEGRDSKPIYAIADDMACSAALYLGSQADSLYSTSSGMIGSIGTYTLHRDQSLADAQQGYKYTYISAGKYKTEGNPHEPLSQDTKSYVQGMVDELQGEFVSAVARGRKTTVGDVEENYGQGRVLRSKKALDVGMIDGITTFDSLLNQVASSRPRSISVVHGGQTYEASLIGNILHLGGTMSQVVDETTTDDVDDPTDEHVEQEHGDPGQTDVGRPSDKEDKDNEDRFDPPPIVREEPENNVADENKATANAGAQLREIFSLDANASTDQLLQSARDLVAEVAPFRDAENSLNEKKSFAEAFPERARELERLRNKDITTEANAFGNSFLNIYDGNGKSTNRGFPSVVTQKISDIHKSFALGTPSLSELTDLLNTIGQTGLVEYSEEGSSRVDSTTGKEGRPDKLFAEKVVEIQEADSVDRRTAVKLTKERHPDLYDAYRASLPGRRS